jgi:putative ABC transport system permease protein
VTKAILTLSFWWQDARRAVRFLGRHPLFALGVILVLAIGIGPVAALVGLMNVAFLRPWQVPEPDRLAIFRARTAVGEAYGEISIAEYRFLRQHSRSLSHIAASRSVAVSVDDGSGRQVRLNSVSVLVSADYFDALLVGMTLGRGFVADEEDYGAPKAVAIISHHLWRTHFDSDPAIIGRTVLFGRQHFVLVGVAPRGFVADSRGGRRTDVWMPLPAGALLRRAPPDLAQFADPRGTALGLLAGRLSSGATRASAAAELSVLSRQFRSAAALSSTGFEAIDTRPMSRWPPGFLGSTLPVQALLALTVILMLVLACTNAGHLLLARAISRRREIAIHLSLGASRVRVVRQLLMEAAVLSTLAGALGLGLAFAAPRLIVGLGFGYAADGFYRLTSPDLVELSHYAPDALVFWLALGLVSVTAVVAGLAPALQATHDTLTSLSADRHGSTATGSRWRNGLLVAQIAVTTVLLVGAGLLTRAIGHAAALNPGFAIKDVQVVSVQPKILPTAMSTRGKAFFVGLRDALQNSDLGSVAFADEPPFWDVNLVMNARRPESPETIQSILMRRVSRDYFGVLGIPIVKGRIPDSDTESRELVVNEAAARALWAAADPIGRTLESAISRTEFQPYIVVGIAKNVPVRSMSEIEPVIYRTPDWMPTDWTATFLVRGGPPGVGQRVRAVAASLEPQVTVTERPMVDYVRDSLTTAALASRVAWAIGALGLVLAMVGAFGVFAQAAEARRREIGIRMALGSSRAQIARLVLLTASKALAWGLAVGYLLSLMSVPILRRFLYGLSPFDPVAYAGVAGILMLAGAVATWIPVRRAMVVDPATTLRSE